MVDAQQLGRVHGHGPENVHGRDSGRAPHGEVVEHEVGAERPECRSRSPCRTPCARRRGTRGAAGRRSSRQHGGFGQYAAGRALDVEVLARKIGSDEEHALGLHARHLRVRQVEAVLDGVHAGLDGVVQRVAAVDVDGDRNPGPVRLVDGGSEFLQRPMIGVIVRDQF